MFKQTIIFELKKYRVFKLIINKIYLIDLTDIGHQFSRKLIA
jgi:hypothetical protein